MKCPNKNSKDWLNISYKYGENIAWASYIRNREEIPSLSYVDNWVEDKLGKDKLEIINKETKHLLAIKEVITSQLEELGIGVGALTEYERKTGIQGNTINGVFDPSSSQKTAEGLVELIRIAQNNRGLKALPEEFAHLVDASLNGMDNPIYNRLTNLLKDNNIVKEVLNQEENGSYERYSSIYNNNADLLASEARAKLIAKHIIRGEEIKESPWQSLMQRVKQLFNKIFGKANSNNLKQKLYEIDIEYGKFSSDLMSGQVQINIDFNNLRTKNLLYNAQQNLSIAEETLKKVIETEHKRLKIVEANKRLSEDQLQDLKEREINLNRLENLKNEKRYDEGILDFISQAYTDLNTLLDKIPDLKLNNNIPTSDLQNTAKFLREMKTFIDAYSTRLEDIIKYTLTEEYKRSNIDISEPLKDFTAILQRAEIQYKEASIPLFSQFIKQFTGDLIGKTIKGTKITEDYIENLLVESPKDIGILDRWLFSMAESSDLLLRLIERPVKNARFKAKEKTDETIRQLQKAQEDLEKAGYKTDFIYERNSHGELTGRYIQAIDWNKFYEAQKKQEELLNNKYGNRNNSSLWWKEFYKWRNSNMTQDSTSGKWIPKESIYSNPAYTSLSPAQKIFYDKVIAIKLEADSYLPENKMNPYLLPQIRKDFLERLKEAKSLKEARKLFGSGVADKWLARESDDEFGNTYRLQDFDGTKLDLLPVYYTTKLDDMSQLSTDIVSSLALYTDMAYNYDAMNKIIDIMEVGKDIMSNRNIDDTIGGKNIIERFQHGGRTIVNKTIKPKGSSHFIDRLESFYSSQIYGETQKDQGSFKLPFIDSQISIAKAANNLNQFTALNTYALNLLSGVANVTMGRIMTRVEAISGQYFDVKDLAWADKTYSLQLSKVVSEIGKRRKTGKLDLLMTKFNVLQDHEKAIREIEQNKKNVFVRLCNSSALFFLNNCGEHYLQTRSFLALMKRMKLKDSTGKEINLWDAYQVTKDSDGIEIISLKEGVTKLDGTEFTSEDVEKLSRKTARINQKLHGIYNKEDMNAFQTTAQGRLAMMFRKWIVSSFNRRFQGENYSFDLDNIEQGYYNSTYNFFKVLYKDLKNHQFNFSTRWKELNPTQRSNALRAVAEVGHFLGLVISYGLLSNAWDGDDEWYKSFLLYQIRRLRTEVGVLVPGPQVLQEGLTILKSPAAGINYMQNLMNLLYITNALEDPIQSGQYEGWNKTLRDIVKVVPFNNTIRRAFSPEEALKFYSLSN